MYLKEFYGSTKRKNLCKKVDTRIIVDRYSVFWILKIANKEWIKRSKNIKIEIIFYK